MATTDKVELTVHDRDPEQLRDALCRWLPTALSVPGPVAIDDLALPDSGYSSATVLCTARWAGGSRELAVRLPPEETSLPVFPGYDFDLQRAVVSAVRAVGVPAPEVLALDAAGEVAGAPMLLFARGYGEVPSDNPPYVFGGWVLDAGPGQRRRMLTASMDVLARVHTADPAVVPALAPGAARTGDEALRRHFEAQRAYYEWTFREDGIRIPVLDRAFDRLEEDWPQQVSDPVLCWGDARIGNIGYTDFAPTAVYDWEMACVGPRELDLGWFCFLHRFFQDIAEVFELPGMPDFLHRDDVAAAYEEASGQRVRDFDWFLLYAALRQGIVMSRIKRRMVSRGEDQLPDDPDDYVMHQASLHRMLDGDYDWGTRAGAPA